MTSTKSPTSGRSVLVVMSDERADDVSPVLHGVGYQSRRARTIHEAAEIVNGDPNSVAVLTDLALPDGNWRDLMAHVRAENAEIPVILCAAAGTAELWWDALECGVADILPPAFTAAQFLDVLDA